MLSQRAAGAKKLGIWSTKLIQGKLFSLGVKVLNFLAAEGGQRPKRSKMSQNPRYLGNLRFLNKGGGFMDFAEKGGGL